MKYLVTSHRDNKEKEELQRQGLYCYDLRECDDGTGIATIEKSVVVNRVGSIITDEEIKFQDSNFVDYVCFEKVNDNVSTMEELLQSKNEKCVVEDKSDELQFYNEDEIRSIIANKDELYYADDGMNEVIVKFDDIPDFIVDINRKNGYTVNLKFYKVESDVYEPVITTIGEFLNRVDPEIREKIIKRLVDLQTGEIEPKEYKVIDEDEFENIEMEQEMSKNQKNKKKDRGDR